MNGLFCAQLEARAPRVVVKYAAFTQVGCNDVITELTWLHPLRIVTHRQIIRQRPGKHIPAEAYMRNRTSIARQRISIETF
jgi:hypothetical protein